MTRSRACVTYMTWIYIYITHGTRHKTHAYLLRLLSDGTILIVTGKIVLLVIHYCSAHETVLVVHLSWSISSSNDHWSDWLSLPARPKTCVCERRYHGTIFPVTIKIVRVKIALLSSFVFDDDVIDDDVIYSPTRFDALACVPPSLCATKPVCQ